LPARGRNTLPSSRVRPKRHFLSLAEWPISAPATAFTRQIETALERLETRLRSADREIAELETALGLQRKDLREWQEFVDQRLGDL
jgi:hypothetical protein